MHDDEQNWPDPEQDLLTPDERRAGMVALGDGPRSPEEVAAAMGIDADDPDEVEFVVQQFAEDDRCHRLVDGRLADQVVLLDGIWLTRRLTAVEIGQDLVYGDLSLQSLTELGADSLPLTSGDRLVVDIRDSDIEGFTQALHGREGMLADARPGDLVALRLHQGIIDLRLVPADDPAADPGDPSHQALADLVHALAEEVLAVGETTGRGQGRASGRTLILNLAARRPELLAGPTPPLCELLQRRGWHVGEATVARDPADQMAPLSRMIANIMLTRERYTDAQIDSWEDLLDLRIAVHEDPGGLDPRQVDAAVWALRDPVMAQRFIGRVRGHQSGAATARAVLDRHPSVAGADLVLADRSERDGDLEGMEGHLRDALQADPEFNVAAEDLAWLATLRGDYAEAARLYRQAGLAGSPAGREARQMLRPDKSGPSRNAPCPCGSGRKFKQCHGDVPGGSLARRAEPLRNKLLDFLGRPHREGLHRHLAELRLGPSDPEFEHDPQSDPLLSDLVTFDLGGLQSFLTQAGDHLPSDERDLLATWENSERRVWRVLDSRGGQISLHVGGEEQVQVPVPAGLPMSETGAQVLGRVVDGGGRPMMFNGMISLGTHVAPGVAEALVDPSSIPEDLARLLSVDPRRSLSNREGQPSVYCAAQYTVDDVGRAWAVLAAADDLTWREGDDLVWMGELSDSPEESVVRGRLTRTAEDQIQVVTNGEERMDHLHAVITDVLPGAERLTDRRTPTWLHLQDQQLLTPVRSIPQPTAEQQALVQEIIREAERSWCDEPIPALGDLTPRQALDHPIARSELLDLLDSFPPGQQGAFDPDRIRTHLGI